MPGGLEKFIGFAFGESGSPSEQPRMMDFEQDADAIYASFLMAYGMDLTEIPFLHWYKFLVLLRLLVRTRRWKSELRFAEWIHPNSRGKRVSEPSGHSRLWR